MTRSQGGAPRAAAEHVRAGAGSDISAESPLFYLDLDTITDAEFNRDPGDLKSLKRSIRENGLITPLACTPDGKLLAGRRRFAVLKELGWKKAPFLVITPQDEAHAFRIMLDENVQRKPFTDPEMASLIKQFHQMKVECSLGDNEPETIVEANRQYWSMDDTAQELCISRPTVSQAIKVAELVEQRPEWAHLKGEQVLRNAKIEHQLQELQEFLNDPPNELYDVIVTDVPWEYEGGTYDPDTQRTALPYPDMSIDEITKLCVPASENCILWFWTINRRLHDAFHILAAWGFEPKTVLTWVKDRFGTGRWLRGQTEHCILAIKGSPVWNNTTASTVIYGPLREHSRKPDEFYAMVDSLCHGRKLDMFSREKREGWDQWGDEVDKF